MKLINIGFGNMVNVSRIITIVSPESAPIKRIIGDAKEKGTLIDATHGRRTKAVIIMLKQLLIDRPYIDGKYHRLDKPFNSFARMAHHGWDADPA
ncbi:MAG: DUF370 domain-containing protein, partial [Clostridia bacterium]|nr:DUF370 domain-containing protein [Clostridia bacterium]